MPKSEPSIAKTVFRARTHQARALAGGRDLQATVVDRRIVEKEHRRHDVIGYRSQR